MLVEVGATVSVATASAGLLALTGFLLVRRLQRPRAVRTANGGKPKAKGKAGPKAKGAKAKGRKGSSTSGKYGRVATADEVMKGGDWGELGV